MSPILYLASQTAKADGQTAVNFENRIHQRADNEQEIDMLTDIDTGKASLIHKIFPSKPESDVSIWKHTMLPYLATALTTYGVLLCGAAMKLPTLIKQSPSLKLPFLLDINVMWMFLVTIPVAVVLIVSERLIIPDGIGKIIASGVLEIGEQASKDLAEKWEQNYQRANLLGQGIGIVVSLSVSAANYQSFMDNGFVTWQAVQGQLYFVGWYYLLCILLAYFVISMYVIRNFTTILFLGDIVGDSKIEITPFHPDRCGGLEPVGRIGLRNQYILSLVGVNIVFLLITFFILDSNIYLQVFLVIIAIAYMILGPISFMGPLIPFRKAMKQDKARLVGITAEQIKKEFKRITALVEVGKLTEEDEQSLARYEKIGNMVASLPVWPFDTLTLRKFFSAYIFPVITMVVVVFIEKLISKYLVIP